MEPVGAANGKGVTHGSKHSGNKVHPVPAKKPPAGPDALGQTPLKAASPRKESKSEKQTAEPTLVKQFSSKTNDIEAATPSMVSVATDVLPDEGSKLNLKKGDKCLYLDKRSGTTKEAQVMSVDYALVPPSYVIMVDGHERETEEDRLSRPEVQRAPITPSVSGGEESDHEFVFPEEAPQKQASSNTLNQLDAPAAKAWMQGREAAAANSSFREIKGESLWMTQHGNVHDNAQAPTLPPTTASQDTGARAPVTPALGAEDGGGTGGGGGVGGGEEEMDLNATTPYGKIAPPSSPAFNRFDGETTPTKERETKKKKTLRRGAAAASASADKEEEEKEQQEEEEKEESFPPGGMTPVEEAAGPEEEQQVVAEEQDAAQAALEEEEQQEEGEKVEEEEEGGNNVAAVADAQEKERERERGERDKVETEPADLRQKILQNASTKEEEAEGAAAEAVAVEEEEEIPMLDMEGLLQRQFEVESMLRWKLSGEAELQKAMATVDDLLLFIANVKKLSRQLKVTNHGLVFQELLGRAGKKREGECIITGMVDLSSVPEPECNTMVGQVETLRELIRVKIQDGADVDTAAVTLKDCRSFFHSLQAHAQEKGKSPFELLEEVRKM